MLRFVDRTIGMETPENKSLDRHSENKPGIRCDKKFGFVHQPAPSGPGGVFVCGYVIWVLNRSVS